MFTAFMAIYQLLQQKAIYNNTLGKITLNYVRIDSNGSSFIRETKIPFTRFEEKKAINWDTKYYFSIRDSMYASNSTAVIYRYAFYPFFPLVWKVSHTNVHGIVFLNYLFFGISLILLCSIFLKGNKSEMFYFIVALLLPSSISFYLPYTESMFMLTFSIALIGLLKKKYWLFFIALFCCSMTRPSALILAAVFMCINLLNLFYHKKILWFLKDFCLTIMPILLAWLTVILIQYYYSSSWNTYNIACSFWPKDNNLYRYTSDWSIEGFGMTAFAIFAFVIPACIYGVVWGVSSILGDEKENGTSLFSGNEKYLKLFLFNVSSIFIIGFILFNIQTSGYVLNGIHRYTLASPFFFIILFQLPEKLKSVPFKYKLSGFIIVFISIAIFLLSTEYAGNLFRFKYLGLYLLLTLMFYLVIESHVSRRVKLALLILIIIPCLVWHAYLFNMYLGDAWIFT